MNTQVTFKVKKINLIVTTIGLIFLLTLGLILWASVHGQFINDCLEDGNLLEDCRDFWRFK